MSLIQSTLEMYVESARDAAQAMPRTALALMGLLLVTPVLGAIGAQLSGLGIVGGLVMSLLQAGAAGWYLSLVEIGVHGRRSIRPTDLKDQVGTYLWEVISVLFIFWIASMVLGLLGLGVVTTVVILAAIVAFNPAPEMIYQERSQSVALLQDAAKFMQHNWPEWLVPHVALAAILLGVTVTIGPFGGFMHALMALGPFFGFTNPSLFSGALASGDFLGLVGGMLVLVIVHWALLFRGHLYRRLRSSSRRGRAWSGRA